MADAPSTAFELLEKPIQRALWDMQWSKLRPIQIDAIQKVTQSCDDLIISARTASGKTEAAFLPILSEVFREPKSSVQAVYVGPLKALINDQFRRLEDLCQRAGIPVHRWHGDVDAGKKKKFLDRPSGVLLITPESLESMFINRSNRLATVFKHLQYVVIDEIHSLVGTERGTHLRSLLSRIERYCSISLIRILGLSATLGDAFPIYENWMRPQGKNPVSLIEDPGEQKQVRFKIYGYETLAEKAAGTPDNELIEDDKITPVIQDCFKHMAGQKNLIFANSKQKVEWFADSLNGCCRAAGIPDQFLVHHGSLSREVREFTETEMRNDRPITIVCSSTLELGIDIGNVATVGQLGPTWSVNSQVQRLGRSGRGEDEEQCMRVYVTEEPIDEKTSLVDRLRSRLLQSIAMTELMLEKWVEPPYTAQSDFSTLTQQILSILAETGGTDTATLFERTISIGAFQTITKPQFVGLLRSLAFNKLIEQMAQGDLILAPAGEDIVGHYSFYSAFASSVEFSVVFGSQKIGTLPAVYLPQVADHFLLAGRRWQVLEIHDQQKEILVMPAKGRKPTKFFGGSGEIHRRVREMMKSVLNSKKQFGYLNDGANDLLEQARGVANSTGLSNSDWVALGPNECLWFTWTGTKIQRTLRLICEKVNLKSQDCEIALQFPVGLQEAQEIIFNASKMTHEPIVLAQLFNAKQVRKFDEFVSIELLDQAIANDALDVAGAMQLLNRKM